MTAPRPTRVVSPVLALLIVAGLAACGRSGAAPTRASHTAAGGGAPGADPYGTCTTEAAAGEPGCDETGASSTDETR